MVQRLNETEDGCLTSSLMPSQTYVSDIALSFLPFLFFLFFHLSSITDFCRLNQICSAIVFDWFYGSKMMFRQSAHSDSRQLTCHCLVTDSGKRADINRCRFKERFNEETRNVIGRREDAAAFLLPKVATFSFVIPFSLFLPSCIVSLSC